MEESNIEFHYSVPFISRSGKWGVAKVHLASHSVTDRQTARNLIGRAMQATLGKHVRVNPYQGDSPDIKPIRVIIHKAGPDGACRVSIGNSDDTSAFISLREVRHVSVTA